MVEIQKELHGILELIDEDELKDYVSYFFMEDVNKYLQFIDQLDSQLYSKKFIAAEINKKYFQSTDEIIQKAEELEKNVSHRIIVEKVKNAFRALLIDSPVLKSILIKRAFDKPRGYPGDYKMIELFYDNKPISKGIGYCGDKYILNDDYVRAVRNRKDYMKILLRDFIQTSDLASINILNLGCGSSKEIRELFMSDFHPWKNISFTLVDQDQEALIFSQNALRNITGNVKFNLVTANIINILKNDKSNIMFRNQDLIYSIGLADYLPDFYLGRLIKYCFEKLEFKGKLILAHKNIKEHKALAPDWFCGWNFFPRNKNDLLEIIETYIETPNYEIELRENEMQHIFFFIIHKL
jgi:hypothetical protein